MKELKDKTRTIQMHLRIHKEIRQFSSLEELQLIDKSLALCKKILLELNEEAPNMRSVTRWQISLEICTTARLNKN